MNAALRPHPCLQTTYPASVHFTSSPSAPAPTPYVSGCFFIPPASSSPPPDSFRVLQWNAGGLRARSTEILHFILPHLFDLIYIQELNLNSPSSFWMPGFSSLQSDRTLSLSSILSPDVTNASGGVIFSSNRAYLSLNFLTPLSLLDPYSHYVGVKTFLNKPSYLSFINVYATRI